MGKVVPFRKPRRTSRWTRSEAYVGTRPRGVRWFPIALVALPLAAFTAVMLMPLGGGPEKALGATRFAGSGDTERAQFGPCTGPVRVTCVVDGDTIWYEGEKIRIADLDTPEVFSPGCPREAELGRRATARMQALLNEGPFSLEPDPDGETRDKYGRRLMLVTRGGESLGSVLVSEGLAERWGGPRVEWC